MLLCSNLANKHIAHVKELWHRNTTILNVLIYTLTSLRAWCQNLKHYVTAEINIALIECDKVLVFSVSTVINLLKRMKRAVLQLVEARHSPFLQCVISVQPPYHHNNYHQLANSQIVWRLPPSPTSFYYSFSLSVMCFLVWLSLFN